MELEKKRGISISSTLLQFEYGNYKLNLLDTPGHKDFSEDTYRVLTAVDGVVMVLDAGKGIESQTLKLFEVCRKRGIPIFTFINKLDRPSLPPLELIDQIEKELDLHVFAVNWPLESGPFFKGVYDRIKKEVHLFERVPGGAFRAPVSIHGINDPMVKEILSTNVYNEIVEELEMLDTAQGGLDIQEVLAGRSTPVFFGSAGNNFGVELLLKGFLGYSSPPVPRHSVTGLVPVESEAFSAFIFKVQTNMNPMHRDRMVYARVCSGKFTRDMTAWHQRLKKEIRLSNAHTIFGRDRDYLEEAFPGDILCFVTNTSFQVGDTITTDPEILFKEIPRFAPECFAWLRNTSPSAYKSFRKGFDHLLAEDIVQSFHLKNHQGHLPLLGAVGPLQFEVMQYRLKDEYGADSVLENMPWTCMRWVAEPVDMELLGNEIPYGAASGTDDAGRPVVLFSNTWSQKNFSAKNPDLRLLESPE
jgi:peptide chain release factor 3